MSGVEKVWSVAASLIAAVIGYLARSSWEWIRALRLKKIYGSAKEFSLIYGELTLNRALPEVIRKSNIHHADLISERPLVKMQENGLPASEGKYFRAAHSACVCDVRAAGYIAAFLGSIKARTTIVGDATFPVPLNTNWISFGTLTNLKTRHLLDNNPFVIFENQRFRTKAGKPIHDGGSETVGEEVDYGIILRVQTGPNNEFTWLACAGARQFGTSGAAYVLAHYWSHILHQLRHHTGSFISLVRVTRNRDESASLLWTVERAEDLAQHELQERTV